VRLHTNFIPQRLARRRRAERRLRVGLMALLAAAGLMLVPTVLLLLFSGERAGLLLDLQRQRKRSLEAVVQSTWWDAENKRLKGARDVVVAAHTNIARWVGVMRELRDRLPNGAWVTQISAAPAPAPDATPAAATTATPAAPVEPAPAAVNTTDPQIVTIKGQATRAEAVGEYLESLNRTAMFSHAVLVGSHPSDLQSPEAAGNVAGVVRAARHVIAFEIRVRLKQYIPEGP